MEKRCSFELFKSNVCHRLKEQGDIDFLIETLKEDMIRQYYDKKWYPESFYLLAMVDYISRENNVPICNDYDDLRQQKMQKMIYPVGILITASVLSDDSVKEDAVKLLCNFVKPTGSQKTSEIRYRENFWIKSLKNLDFTRV